MAEATVEDPARRLRGVPNVMVIGHQSGIIDLKTGRDAEIEPSIAIWVQLLVYAHLFRVTRGYLPDRVEVFSLVRGPVAIDAGRLQLMQRYSHRPRAGA